MGTVNAIGPVYNGTYYPFVGTVDTTGSASGAASSYEQIQELQAENDVLEIGNTSSSTTANSTTSDSTLLSADLLDLSPAALTILNGIENADAAQANGTSNLAVTNNLNITGNIGTTNSLGLTNNLGVTSNLTVNGTTGVQALTPTQQQQAAAIVAQFASQPLTQTTFTQIENALTSVGINPAQVSIQQLLSGYVFAFGSPDFSGQLASDTLAEDLTNA